MPYRNYKIIAVTPAGRRRYMELLLPQILEYFNNGIVDEYHLWVNTKDEADINWMNEKQKEFPNFITLKLCNIDIIKPHDYIYTIGSFFKDCIDDNTIYIRFDDDVVLLDSLESFKNFLDFRIDNPEYFLIYPVILNNAIVSHILQRSGKLDYLNGIVGYSFNDDVGWGNADFANNLHNQVISNLNNGNTLAYYHINNWILYYNEQVSINCICWFGSDLRNVCDGIISLDDEEEDLSVTIPRRIGRVNCIYGGYTVVHFSFYTQRGRLDNAGVLDKYKELLSHKLNF